MNLVDLISVLPFYISFIFPSQAQYAFRFIRILRLFRVVKIFQFSKYSVGLRITSRVFRSSVDQIIMVSTYILVIILLSSSLMYYIERGSWNSVTHQWERYNPNTGELEVSPFQSIAHGFYWSIVTLTTTGYGDEVPYTTGGQAVAAFTMLCGILAIALPTSIIGSNFMNEWQEHRRLRFQARLRKNQKRVAAEEGAGPGFQALLSGHEGKRHLRERNQQLLEVLAEVQERLVEINPPRYYRKYTDAKAELQDALARIGQLELECTRLRKMNANLTKFNTLFKKTAVDNGIAPEPGGADDDLYVTADGNTTDMDLLGTNLGLTLTGRAREKSVAVLNTLFRRTTNGGGSGFATPGSPPPGFATPGSPPPGANYSANESANNTLTSAFMRTFTEPVNSGRWRGGSGRVTPEVEGEGGAGDRQQLTRRPGTHRRGLSSNASVITFQSVEDRDALPSRSGATSPFGSPPLSPRLTLQHVTASLHRMSTPGWRTSTQGSGASGGGWFRMEEADGRRKHKGKRQAGPIRKEMIGEPTDLRRAYAPHPEDVGASTRRKLTEEENPLSMRTVPATNREMESVLGSQYGLWLAERAKMAATSAGDSVQQDGGKAVADKGRSATAEDERAGPTERRPPAFKRVGESLLTLFEPVSPIGGRAGDRQEVKVQSQSQEMIEVVVHLPNEEILRNEDGALLDGERPNGPVNMTDYFPLSVRPLQSSPPVLLHDSHRLRHTLLQRWDQSQGLLLSEGGHHRESNDGEGGAHEQYDGGTGGDLGTMRLGVGGEVRREDEGVSPNDTTETLVQDESDL
ncbi:hypothetical protein BC937DRAFT_93127 [Endogone sp. FLAS-F59071]|nr:hypothetical protein BC937DRAFT_93127 [Endogone sp. FLAS-F59071]|eukprot:RUS14942.1 hypothetical protein BC937DRAFT_93127 [Endogone sp. FLAS-F59071]